MRNQFTYDDTFARESVKKKIARNITVQVHTENRCLMLTVKNRLYIKILKNNSQLNTNKIC